MYKVFFNDRVVTLQDVLPKSFANTKGLFYIYGTPGELRELLEAFHQMEQTERLSLFHDNMRELEAAFRSCFTPVDAGGGLVFNKKGEFLIIKRRGFWDLPKGKLKTGEDFETAALREVEEETGLQELVTVQPLISTYHTYRMSDQLILKKTAWFEMHYPGSAEPVLEAKEGITEYRWVKTGKTGFIKKNTHMSILDVLNIRGLI
jgi:8-oxo-dGTP pyrophosphatase MutT (NUDIX family)